MKPEAVALDGDRDAAVGELGKEVVGASHRRRPFFAHEHPGQGAVSANYRQLLKKMGKPDAEIDAAIEALTRSPE